MFELAVLEKGTYTMNDNLLSIILVTQGRATIISKEETVTLTKGMSAYISPTFNEYTIATDGIVFRAMGK